MSDFQLPATFYDPPEPNLTFEVQAECGTCEQETEQVLEVWDGLAGYQTCCECNETKAVDPPERDDDL